MKGLVAEYKKKRQSFNGCLQAFDPTKGKNPRTGWIKTSLEPRNI